MSQVEAVVNSFSPRRIAFKRLAENRTNAVLERIRILAHCSNRYAYDYDEADVERIFAAIETELETAKIRFSNRQHLNRFTLADE